MQSSVECSKRNGSRSLYIVVETGKFRTILIENSSSICKSEVFEVYVGLGEPGSTGLEEPLNKGVIILSTNARLPKSEIQRVVYEFLVVGSYV